MAMGGKSGTSQVRHISEDEREHGLRKNVDVPWKERDHALFIALRAGRRAALCLRRRRRAWRRRPAAAARRSRRRSCRDVLLEAQKRDPGAARARRTRSRVAAHASASAERWRTSLLDYGGRARLASCRRSCCSLNWGLVLLLGAVAGDRLRDALFRRQRQLAALGRRSRRCASPSPLVIMFAAALVDHPRLARASPIGFYGVVAGCCWSRSRCAAPSAWARSAGSISASSSCSRRS